MQWNSLKIALFNFPNVQEIRIKTIPLCLFFITHLAVFGGKLSLRMSQPYRKKIKIFFLPKGIYFRQKFFDSTPTAKYTLISSRRGMVIYSWHSVVKQSAIYTFPILSNPENLVEKKDCLISKHSHSSKLSKTDIGSCVPVIYVPKSTNKLLKENSVQNSLL